MHLVEDNSTTYLGNQQCMLIQNVSLQITRPITGPYGPKVGPCYFIRIYIFFASLPLSSLISKSCKVHSTKFVSGFPQLVCRQGKVFKEEKENKAPKLICSFTRGLTTNGDQDPKCSFTVGFTMTRSSKESNERSLFIPYMFTLNEILSRVQSWSIFPHLTLW